MTKSIYFPLHEDDLGVVCMTCEPALFKLCTREEIDCFSYVFHQVEAWLTCRFGSQVNLCILFVVTTDLLSLYCLLL